MRGHGPCYALGRAANRHVAGPAIRVDKLPVMLRKRAWQKHSAVAGDHGPQVLEVLDCAAGRRGSDTGHHHFAAPPQRHHRRTPHTPAVLAHAYLAVAAATERNTQPTPTGVITLTVNEFRRLIGTRLLAVKRAEASLPAWSRRHRRHHYRARLSHSERRQHQ